MEIDREERAVVRPDSYWYCSPGMMRTAKRRLARPALTKRDGAKESECRKERKNRRCLAPWTSSNLFSSGGLFLPLRLVSITSLVSRSLASPRPVSISIHPDEPQKYACKCSKCMFYSVPCFSRVRDHIEESTSQFTGTSHFNANLPRALWRPLPDTFPSPPER